MNPDITNNPQVAAIVRAIAYTENGGEPDTTKLKPGKTGETKSIFQFTPDTWKQYAKESGDENLPITPDSETYVASHKVSEWIKKGHTPEQIFSMWNAGPGEPDSYTGKFSDGSSSTGINKKYGVKFDVPNYVKKASGYLKQFSQETAPQPEAAKGFLDKIKNITKGPNSLDPGGFLQKIKTITKS